MKNKKMIIGCFVRNAQIEEYYQGLIKEENHPIDLIVQNDLVLDLENGKTEETMDALEKLDGAVFAVQPSDLEYAESLLDMASFLQEQGREVVFYPNPKLSQDYLEEVKDRLDEETSKVVEGEVDAAVVFDALVEAVENYLANAPKKEEKRNILLSAMKKSSDRLEKGKEASEEDEESSNNGLSMLRNRAVNIKLPSISLPKRSKPVASGEPYNMREEELPENLSLSSVIAVAGYDATSVAHIAWNIAELQQQPTVLLEGRKTGTLAAWLGRNGDQLLVTRDQFLETERGTQHTEYLDLVLIADKKLSNEDLLQMSRINKTIVVDCGTDFESEVFKRAGKKVFVIEADPQHIDHPRPEQMGVTWVLNGWPPGIAMRVESVEQVYGRKFDLVVQQQARQVKLSIWTKKPALHLEMDEAIVNQWVELFGGVTA